MAPPLRCLRVSDERGGVRLELQGGHTARDIAGAVRCGRGRSRA
eukprot:COSAG04_NODE_2711_length_3697_cov_5.529739_7_plen_43_part_01